jgi:glycosyltransferase involved in cell wall biosynthesis
VSALQELQLTTAPPEAPQRSIWIQAVSHLDPRYGGIASMLSQLCGHSERAGIASPVIGFCDPEERAKSALPKCAKLTLAPRSRLHIFFTERRNVREQIQNANGIHIHGIWERHCTAAAGWARAARRPYVVSAHGMLDRWALHQKRLKKALYAALIERSNLTRAACLRALTPAEAQDYRRLGFTGPIAVVPNGVSVPEHIDPAHFLELYPHLSGKRLVLFLGRLHPKKGLLPLLNSWLRVRDCDSHLVIAGPDDGLRPQLEAMVRDGGACDSVTFTGELSGAMKWSALRAANLFVLPSFSEGLSVALLEALALGVPVLFTRECNLPEAAQFAGWRVDPAQGSIEGALKEFLESSQDKLDALGRFGRGLVAHTFRWEIVVNQLCEVYRWIEGGAPPDHVSIV